MTPQQPSTEEEDDELIIGQKQKQHQHQHVPWLGGPGTLLPFHVEAFLAWMLAFGCLGVSGYHYIVDTLFMPYWTSLQTMTSLIVDSLFFWLCQRLRQPLSYLFCCCPTQPRTMTTKVTESHSLSLSSAQLPCWLPLTTYSRSEMDRATPSERMQQLVQILRQKQQQQQQQPQLKNGVHPTKGWSTTCRTTAAEWNDQQLITLIRGNVVLRRLASLAMRPPLVEGGENDNNNNVDVVEAAPLRQQLIRIWPALLRLPVEDEDDDDDGGVSYPFEISLIIACFRERPSHVRSKLHYAYSMARHATSTIQVVLVDAGGNNDDGEGEDLHHLVSGDKPCDCQWGNIKMVDFTKQQQGRGPALNSGAANADGRILAFLHSDTRLPVDWDVKLLDMFRGHDMDDNRPTSRASVDASGDGDSSHCRYVRANAAAFGFGIDMSGLNTKHNRSEASSTREPDAVAGSDDSSYYPPGLRAVQVTANLRCRLWSLPYGDQCLCIPAIVFHHVGGYPHQCFMEDYELIALLRRRKALVHKFFEQGDDNDIALDKSRRMATTATATKIPLEEEEALKIIPGPPALCSPRRWQRLGVLYVTFMNSRLVNLYHARSLTPEDLYERYYGHSLKGCQDLAPWEIQLLRDLQEQTTIKKGKQI